MAAEPGVRRWLRAAAWILAVLIALTAAFALYLLSAGPDPEIKAKRQMSELWQDFPFRSQYLSVEGSTMHYVDEGDPDGPVFLFLHGNPTSSYLWRAVLPAVADAGARAIAVDNIGFGASDRPDIDYRFAEHARYLQGFIDGLGLRDVNLVIHDWGSGLGFDYAYQHSDNVRSIIFMEAIIGTGSIDDLEEPARSIFSAFRTPVVGEWLVLVQNLFIEQGLQGSVLRKLSERELDAYREPFPTWGSRRPVLVWPREIPFDGEPQDTWQRIDAYSAWLPESRQPKLLIYAEPGAILPRTRATELAESWQALDTEFVGQGLHFIQEDRGREIGSAIVTWAGSQGILSVPIATSDPAPDPASSSQQD